MDQHDCDPIASTLEMVQDVHDHYASDPGEFEALLKDAENFCILVA